MTTEVRVPTLGESVTTATVATWFKKPGEMVAVDEMLCELETDKVTVEVPSPIEGTLSDIIALEGDTVGIDALLATITEIKSTKATEAEQLPAKANDVGIKNNMEGVTFVSVPTLGESITEATVSTWFKSIGDVIARDEMLCELETDKVSVEVSAPTSGILSEILKPEGTTVDANAKLAVINRSGGIDTLATTPVTVSNHKEKDIEDAPAAKKAMLEAGISRNQITGTGRDGRAMKDDVARAIAATTDTSTSEKLTMARAPVEAEDVGREERIKMTRLRQTIAKRLKDSQNTAAILTTYNEVDMTEVMALRSEYKDLFLKKHGVKLGFMSFFTKACVHALYEVPEVNAEIDGNDVVYKNFVHMGIAAGAPQGLVVPVIRDVGTLSFAEIEKAIAEKGARARDGKLSMSEMQGGTFTISNGGVYGSLMSSPILNPPQSGILGMHKIQDRPVALSGQVVIRPMMYLALSYDHRIVDGKGAVTFLVRVKEALEDPRRLLMDL